MNPPALVGGTWRVLRPLGEGGAATVYLAEGPEARVAVKFFPQIMASAEEFRTEAVMLGRNRHPNLVRLVDAGVTAEGAPWLALEFVDGPDLRTRLDAGVSLVDEAVGYLIQVFAALDALHRAGLAHGDIKPENVIVQGDRVRVIDFGRSRLAHLYGGSGIFPGTPPYMHPRLFRGGTPDARSDCFAAWIMLHELVTGERPYTSATLRATGDGALPARPPLPDARLERLITAGLDGVLGDARTAWLALQRFQRGIDALPHAPAVPPVVDGALVEELRRSALRGRSMALTGDAERTRATLEAVHRGWTAAGGYALWVRAEAGGSVPLAAALTLAADAAEAFDGSQLAGIAAAIGPLGSAVAAVAPATRAWLRNEITIEGRPEAERITVALSRFIYACPRPLVILVEGLDRIDGSSRRFLASLATTGEAVVIGSAAPGLPHGLPDSRALTGPPPAAAVPGAVPPAAESLLARARLLDLAFGPLLGRASGSSAAEVADAALACEAAGLATWNGQDVVPRPGVLPSPEVAQRWYRDAAARLDVHADALLVARFARLGGDRDRLASVIDAAVHVALRFDPAVALELLDQDPRLLDARRLLHHVQVALLARDLGRARALLERLRGLAGVGAAELAEAEGEVAFRTGDTRGALVAYRRAATALGRPVRSGLVGVWLDLKALWRMWRDLPVVARPDERLGRVFERLHDLQFNHDNAPMLRIHARWLEAAPASRRARAMEMAWSVALGLGARARRIEAALGVEVADEGDPVGAAVALLCRSIARVWRGDVVDAHQDAIEAGERLLRAGDPYLAALACATVGTTTFHLGNGGALRRLVTELEALVRVTGDQRAAIWAAGCNGIVAWSEGRIEAAIPEARAWADGAAARDESTEAFARRFLADLLLEAGDFEGARVAIARCHRLIRQFHLRMDYTDAVLISALIADARGRIAGTSSRLAGAFAERRLAALVARSPRWTPRALAARAWQAAARGDRSAAASGFGAALVDAEARHQFQDAWWVLWQRAAALDDQAAATAAVVLARRHGLGPRGGAP